jgi:hypothetical protein
MHSESRAGGLSARLAFYGVPAIGLVIPSPLSSGSMWSAQSRGELRHW